MLTVDIYFLLSDQSARKVLFTCLANTNNQYILLIIIITHIFIALNPLIINQLHIVTQN